MSLDPDEEATRGALAWFGLEDGPGEWINQTWIARNGDAEMRVVDLVIVRAVDAPGGRLARVTGSTAPRGGG